METIVEKNFIPRGIYIFKDTEEINLLIKPEPKKYPNSETDPKILPNSEE